MKCSLLLSACFLVFNLIPAETTFAWKNMQNCSLLINFFDTEQKLVLSCLQTSNEEQKNTVGLVKCKRKSKAPLFIYILGCLGI